MRAEKMVARVMQELHRPQVAAHDEPARQLDEPVLYYEETNFAGQPYSVPVVILRTRPCEWFVKSGCVMCNYSLVGAGTSGVPDEAVLAQADRAIRRLAPLDRYRYVVFTSPGSFLSDFEVPPAVRLEIARKLRSAGLRRWSIESEARFCRSRRLQELRDAFEGEISVGIGLESADPFVRNVCLNKGLSTAVYERRISDVARAGLSFYNYAVYGKPFLTELEDIEDSVATIRYALERGAFMAVLLAVNVQPRTLVHWLWERGRYRLRSLWGAIEVVLRLPPELRPRVPIKGVEEVAPRPLAAAGTCARCRDRVVAAIRNWNMHRDHRILEDVVGSCDCRDRWWRQVRAERPASALRERVLREYRRVAREMGVLGAGTGEAPAEGFGTASAGSGRTGGAVGEVPGSRARTASNVEAELKALVLRASRSVPYYRETFRDLGIDPRSVNGLEDLRKMPLTPHELLRKAPWKFRNLAEAPVGIHCSGGTTGRPKMLFYAREDLDDAFDRTARALAYAGVSAHDTVAIMLPFGVWFIGTDFVEGARRIGASVLPLGIHMSAEDELRLMKDVGATVLVATPGKLSALSQGADDDGPPVPTVRAIVTAGERFAPAQRALCERIWRAPVVEVYGSAETDTLGVECSERSGVHVWDDRFVFEVVHLSDGRPVGAGEAGELVVTPLLRRGAVLLRYRLGDVVRFSPDPCPCGLDFPRLSVLGRVDESVVLKDGTKVYLYQIEEALSGLREDVRCFKVVVGEESGRDLVEVFVEPASGDAGALRREAERALARMSIDFYDALRSGLVAPPRVKTVEGLDLPVTARGKTLRLFDKRRSSRAQGGGC